MEKRLTDEGIEIAKKVDGLDEITDIEIIKHREQNKPVNKPFKTVREVVREFNNNPKTISAGVKAMPKSIYTILWVVTIFSLLLLFTNLIWANISFSKKNFNPSVNLSNSINVESPVVPVEINNSYLHNINNYNNNNYTLNIDIGQDISNKIADQVINIIKNRTNSS